MGMSTSIRMSAGIAACLLGGFAAAPVVAHHSYGEIDVCTSVTLAGEVQSVVWANPHVVVMLRTDAATEYRIEWANLQQLSRSNVHAQPLHAGDRVVIRGHAHRDPDVRRVTLLSEVHRPSDDWRWVRARARARPSNCGA